MQSPGLVLNQDIFTVPSAVLSWTTMSLPLRLLASGIFYFIGLSQAEELGDFQRTVILIERHTTVGEDLFIRGGIDIQKRQGCFTGTTPTPCSIPIQHINPGSDPHFDKVKAWSKGDNYLDWNGAEPNQGTYKSKLAQGTPAYWSTTDKSHPGYNELNKYGKDYWIVDVFMDCSKTMQGYFELKAYINGGWEVDMNTGAPCKGDSPGSPPYSSRNHFARCGYLNVFHFNSQQCEINTLPK